MPSEAARRAPARSLREQVPLKVNGAVDFLTRLGPARIAAMGVVTFALVGFFAFVIMRVSQPTMGVLFAERSRAPPAPRCWRELSSC